MKHEVILSGFGGQGVMSIGKNLVEAGVEEDLQVSWVPSYGPEMRGGTANCTVILSDERIGSPLVEYPSEVVVMNRARHWQNSARTYKKAALCSSTAALCRTR